MIMMGRCCRPWSVRRTPQAGTPGARPAAASGGRSRLQEQRSPGDHPNSTTGATSHGNATPLRQPGCKATTEEASRVAGAGPAPPFLAVPTPALEARCQGFAAGRAKRALDSERSGCTRREADASASEPKRGCRRSRLRFNPLLTPVFFKTPTTRAASRHRVTLSRTRLPRLSRVGLARLAVPG